MDRAGPNVKFVDYDHSVGYFDGRFCQKGVDGINEGEQPKVIAAHLPHLSTDISSVELVSFYELDTWDPLGSNPWKRSEDHPQDRTFEGSVNEFAQITLLMGPNAELAKQGFISDAAAADVAVADKLAVSGELADLEVPNVLPDRYGASPACRWRSLTVSDE